MSSRPGAPGHEPRTYEITLKNAGTPGLPAPVAPAPEKKAAGVTAPSKGSPDEPGPSAGPSPVDEIIIGESLQVLADYAGLLGTRPADGKAP